MDDLTRRRLIKGTAALGLGIAAQPVVPSRDAAAAASVASEDWIVLETAIKETVLDGHRVRLRAYNGQIPGPTITIVPGQTLRIRLKNSLPPYDSSQWNGDHNVPHGLDATNLHVHGLDVVPHLFEPVGTSDPAAPMIVVGPGETKDYVFEIPSDHPPGFNFYHPHKHGSTAVQLISGLAGGLIVRGAIDEVPEIKAAREIPLVIQDIGLFPSETDPDIWTYEPVQNAVWQTFGGFVTIKGERTNLRGGYSTGDYRLRYYLLNGQPFFKETHNDDIAKAREPIGTQLPVQRFTIAPGEVVRFRMLNGNSDLTMPIVVDGHDVHQIAMDGTNFQAVRTIPARAPGDTTEQILLASANRADFLIKGSTAPGIYKIRQLAQSQQFLISEEKVIAEIEVTGDPKNMGLPDKLPIPARAYPLIEPSEVKRIRMIEFTGNTPALINTIIGGDYLINNAIYQMEEVPTVVNLNECEEWHIRVGMSHAGGTEGHPFHIHVNAFEVISIAGKPMPPGTIQDTVWVPQDQTVIIRMRFKQWVGKAVYHCHIIPHEDVGMIQNFLIVDPMKMAKMY
jgi:suppressor of ftsI